MASAAPKPYLGPIDAQGNPIKQPINAPATGAGGSQSSSGAVLAPGKLSPVVGTGPDTGMNNPMDEDPNAPENAPAGKQSQAALNQWDANLPGFLQNQIGGAQQSARMNLAQDIQNTKTSANSRGLLFSGMEAGGEDMAKAEGSAQLGQNIQAINSGAQDITTAYEQNAQAEANNEDANTLAIQQQQVDQSQASYELALQDMQSQSSWYSQLFSGLGSIAGGVAGAVVGGPAGAVVGASAGSKL